MLPSHLRSFRCLIVALQVGSLVAGAACVSACAVETASEEEIQGEHTEGLTMNGLTMNGLTMNGLTMNGLTMNGLTMNGLTMNGLTMNGLTASGLTQNGALVGVIDGDANARLFLSYVVGCALPAGGQVVVAGPAGQASYTFSGGMGLAPEWSVAGGTCGPHCQAEVSACVIARVNALGQHVSISLRGRDDELAVTPTERAGYTHREATYFGNALTVPQKLFACRAAADDQTLIGRVCGQGANVSGCAVSVLGDCAGVCAVSDAGDGYFTNCATPDGGARLPAVTVFRQ